ncbi:MAG: flagellar hook capping protein [Verrucomicrobiales bacterium]|jgi:flagellar basal-body rod modification protein FlgD|nr:flagellar hook capping protein [Verrucomicrobiales bacterium]
MSSVAATNSATYQNPAADVSSRIPVHTLNQNDFLKLVVAQMTSQDPLNPQKDSDFVAQMAQFTTLEQTKTMQGDISDLRAQQRFLQADATLGRVVSLEDSKGTVTTGVVSSIQVEAGTPKLVVNGQAHDMTELVSIQPAATNP